MGHEREKKKILSNTYVVCAVNVMRAKSKSWLSFHFAWQYLHSVLSFVFAVFATFASSHYYLVSIFLGSADPLYVTTGRGNEFIYIHWNYGFPYTRSWAYIKQVDDLIKPVMRHPLLFFSSFSCICVSVCLSAFSFKKNITGATWLLLPAEWSPSTPNTLSTVIAHFRFFFCFLPNVLSSHTHTIR